MTGGKYQSSGFVKLDLNYIQMRIILLIYLLFGSLYSFAERYKVTRVIDGDTFVISSGERVRIIGINAPEISDLYGSESKQYLINLIENHYVELESDPVNKDKDQYQRLLRYVQLNGLNINEKMIQDGYAFAYLKYNFSKKDRYRNLQVGAMNQKVGIWSDSNDNGISGIIKNNKIHFSIRTYVAGFSIITLILIGFYYFFKK